MTYLVILEIFLLVGVSIAYLLRARARSYSASQALKQKTYLDLRNAALQTSRAKLGLPPASSPDEPWGVMMDWGLGSGTATVAAFSDGTASVYLSSGGGFIGGGQSAEAVRMAAKEMVVVAGGCRSQMRAATIHPLPQNGEVSFYLLTDQGVFSASAREQELKSKRHPLWRLGETAQSVITWYHAGA